VLSSRMSLTQISPAAAPSPRIIFLHARFSAVNFPHVGAEPSTRPQVRVPSRRRGISPYTPEPASDRFYPHDSTEHLRPRFAPTGDTSSCNTQLQLATFPRSVDYAGLKSNLSPFRINTSKLSEVLIMEDLCRT
jgi:hypothetical protein